MKQHCMIALILSVNYCPYFVAELAELVYGLPQKSNHIKQKSRLVYNFI